jgi:hypothetical protein
MKKGVLLAALAGLIVFSLITPLSSRVQAQTTAAALPAFEAATNAEKPSEN